MRRVLLILVAAAAAIVVIVVVVVSGVVFIDLGTERKVFTARLTAWLIRRIGFLFWGKDSLGADEHASAGRAPILEHGPLELAIFAQ